MSDYNAQDIEVLTGLDPVKKRPGMYTDTSRPNHLAQEVIDNSVDEALAGHARRVDVTYTKMALYPSVMMDAACQWIYIQSRVCRGLK